MFRRALGWQLVPGLTLLVSGLVLIVQTEFDVAGVALLAFAVGLLLADLIDLVTDRVVLRDEVLTIHRRSVLSIERQRYVPVANSARVVTWPRTAGLLRAVSFQVEGGRNARTFWGLARTGELRDLIGAMPQSDI